MSCSRTCANGFWYCYGHTGNLESIKFKHIFTCNNSRICANDLLVYLIIGWYIPYITLNWSFTHMRDTSIHASARTKIRACARCLASILVHTYTASSIQASASSIHACARCLTSILVYTNTAPSIHACARSTAFPCDVQNIDMFNTHMWLDKFHIISRTCAMVVIARMRERPYEDPIRQREPFPSRTCAKNQNI